MKLHEKIKNAMLNIGVDQQGFAKLIGVHPTMVSHWLTGRYPPSKDKMAKIAELTKRPIEYFVEDSENASQNLKARSTQGEKRALNVIGYTPINLTPQNSLIKAYTLDMEGIIYESRDECQSEVNELKRIYKNPDIVIGTIIL